MPNALGVPIIDLHAHLHPFPSPVGRCGPDDLLRVMDRLDIRLTAVSSTEAILHDMAGGNEALARDLAGRERLRGYVFGNPNFVEASREQLRRYLDNEQFIGVKLYSGAYVGKALNCPEHFMILDVVAHEFPWALVLFHCGENDPANAAGLADVADRFPELTFLAGHMGAGRWREALPTLAAHRNIIAEISAPVAARCRIEDAVRIMGPDRVVFGSDFPIISPGYMLGCVLDAGIARQHKEMLLFDTPDALLRRVAVRM